MPGRQGRQAGLERQTFLQEGSQGLRHQPLGLWITRGAKLWGRICDGLAGADRLRRDVEVHHDAGVHGDEIDLGHIVMQADRGLVNQAALVGAHQI